MFDAPWVDALYDKGCDIGVMYCDAVSELSNDIKVDVGESH